jgi:hypothetical protein
MHLKIICAAALGFSMHRGAKPGYPTQRRLLYMKNNTETKNRIPKKPSNPEATALWIVCECYCADALHYHVEQEAERNATILRQSTEQLYQAIHSGNSNAIDEKLYAQLKARPMSYMLDNDIILAKRLNITVPEARAKLDELRSNF